MVTPKLWLYHDITVLLHSIQSPDLVIFHFGASEAVSTLCYQAEGYSPYPEDPRTHPLLSKSYNMLGNPWILALLLFSNTKAENVTQSIVDAVGQLPICAVSSLCIVVSRSPRRHVCGMFQALLKTIRSGADFLDSKHASLSHLVNMVAR